MKIEIVRQLDLYWFRVKDTAGEILAQSEPYKSRQAALNGAKTFTAIAPVAAVLDLTDNQA